MASIIINLVIGLLLALMVVAVFEGVRKDVQDKRSRGWSKWYAARKWLIVGLIIAAVILFEWKIWTSSYYRHYW